MNNTAHFSPAHSRHFPLPMILRPAPSDPELIELPEAGLTVRQNLTYFSRRYRSSSIVLEKRIGYICKALRLYSFMDRKYADCSIAQKLLAQKARRWIDSGDNIP